MPNSYNSPATLSARWKIFLKTVYMRILLFLLFIENPQNPSHVSTGGALERSYLQYESLKTRSVLNLILVYVQFK